jgi:hypothetical protein
MTDKNDITLSELWDRMSDEQKKAAFFLLFGIVEFYADPGTWFAASVVADPPSGDITRDVRLVSEKDTRWEWGQGHYKPGARARLAHSWIISMWKKLI